MKNSSTQSDDYDDYDDDDDDYDVVKIAKEWANMDPNAMTKKQVMDCIVVEHDPNDDKNNKNNKEEDQQQLLKKWFPPNNKRIGFGTAGLRGEMQPGPMGMNDLTIIQATQGLAKYYIHQHYLTTTTTTNNNNNNNDSNLSNDEEKKLVAVIGYDHRCSKDNNGLSSEGFARLAQLVLLESGFHSVVVLDGYVATPFVAFAVRYLQATVGIMMTASHNPAKDAGYKVYHSNGCQIRSPVDTHIATSIQHNLTPWNPHNYYYCSNNNDTNNSSFTNVEMTQQIINAYYSTIPTSLLSSSSQTITTNNTAGVNQTTTTTTTTTTNTNTNTNTSDDDEQPPGMVYTAMHGVGYPWAQRLFLQNNYKWPMFASTPQQQEPDPTFPTVSFPNPEESGALDMAMTFAKQNNNCCTIVVAHDPDADRMALAEFSTKTNQWTTFTGDQIGVMLAHHLWNTIGKSSSKPVAMCVSTVSSAMLSVIAKKEGFYLEQTLTGFKWIGSRLVDLAENEGYHSLFGYEEAIGFCCNPYDGNVYDKDGIRAMAVLSDLVYQHLYNKTLNDYMQELYNTYGEFVSNNGYYYCSNMSKVTELIKQNIIIHPHTTTNNNNNNNKDEENEKEQQQFTYITHVGSYEIESIRDLGYYKAYDSTTIDHKPTLPVSSSSPMLTLRFTNGCVAQFRGSGTEPKFKYYIEMCGQPGVPRTKVQSDLTTMSTILLEELLHVSQNKDLLQSL